MSRIVVSCSEDRHKVSGSGFYYGSLLKFLHRSHVLFGLPDILTKALQLYHGPGPRNCAW